MRTDFFLSFFANDPSKISFVHSSVLNIPNEGGNDSTKRSIVSVGGSERLLIVASNEIVAPVIWPIGKNRSKAAGQSTQSDQQ